MSVVLVYSHDRNVRADVIDALGETIGGEDLEIREAATAQAVFTGLNRKGVDCVILDAEATPFGGMGLAKQIRDEYDPCPKMILLVAREADSWLAAWSGVDAVHAHPVDPLTLPAQVGDLLFIGVV